MMSFKVIHRFATLLPLGLVIALVGCGLSNTVNGLNSMPPKGMCMGCSEEDFRNLIVFLSGQSE